MWVFFGFMLAQALVTVIFLGMQQLGVSFDSVNIPTFNTLIAVLVYALAIAIVLGVPWLVKKRKTTKEELGLQRWPRWMDIVWTPAGLIVYLILTAALMYAAMQLLTFVDYTQTQENGFSQIASQWEYILAFISLVIIAPVAEEVLFRGYLFGKLRKYVPIWASILVTSLVFAVVHGQWNVGIDVFALSIVLCLLRVVTGSLWASILLHALKNGIAYYFLFINPIVL